MSWFIQKAIAQLMIGNPDWESVVPAVRAVARTLIGGGGGCIFIYSGSARLASSLLQKKLVGQNLNIWIYTPQLSTSDGPACGLLGTLRFTERQRDGNVLRQRVNWKEMNNYSCKQFIWILDTRFSCCLERQITYFHVLYTTPTYCIQPVEL